MNESAVEEAAPRVTGLQIVEISPSFDNVIDL